MVTYAVKTPPQHGAWSDYLDVWRTTDDIDTFTVAWNFDHFYPLKEPVDGPCLEGWTTLAALARETKRLRIGTMVTGMHYRHPAVTANMAVTLDHVSDGRFILGLGAGWYIPESEAYGIPLGTLQQRMDRFDEGVEIITSLLSNETTSFAGKFYEVKDAYCEPKPLQQPRMPIVIGGRGEKRTLRTVARHAEMWDALMTPVDEYQRLHGVLTEHCAAEGRDVSAISTSVHLPWTPDDDPAELAGRTLPYAAAGVDMIVFSMRGPYLASMVEPLAKELEAL